MADDDVVQLTVVGSEAEAALICGYLESLGIRATYDKGGVMNPIGSYMGANVGPQQILVRAEDADAARAALAERQ